LRRPAHCQCPESGPPKQGTSGHRVGRHRGGSEAAGGARGEADSTHQDVVGPRGAHRAALLCDSPPTWATGRAGQPLVEPSLAAPRLPLAAQESRKLVNCRSKFTFACSPRNNPMAACRSSLLFPEIRSSSPWIEPWTLIFESLSTLT